MVMVLSLLVYGVAERECARLAEQQETIPNQINQSTSTPTLRWVFQLLSGIHSIKIATDEQVSYVFEGITKLKQKKIYSLEKLWRIYIKFHLTTSAQCEFKISRRMA
jgi:hypothetical protein